MAIVLGKRPVHSRALVRFCVEMKVSRGPIGLAAAAGLLWGLAVLCSYYIEQTVSDGAAEQHARLISPSGSTLAARFTLPAGYRRLQAPPGSFGRFLGNLPLKPDGTPVRLFNGALKIPSNVHAAVIDLMSAIRICSSARMR